MSGRDSSDPLLLVTGASGFLGAAVVRATQAAGWRVRAAWRTRRPPAEADEDVRVDLTHAGDLASLCRDVDAVVHCAGLAHRFGNGDDADWAPINRDAAARIVQAAADAGARDFVLASSISVYGVGATGVCTEETPCAPDTPYGRSKLEGEAAAEQVARRTGIRLTMLRLATLYGPGDPGNVGRLLNLVGRRWFLPVGAGHNLKTLLYVDDAARAVVLALRRKGPAIATFNVAAPPVPLCDVLAAAYAAIGRRPASVRLPAAPVLSLLRMAARISGPASAAGRLSTTLVKWTATQAVDGSRFARDTGFAPQVSLEAGMRRSAAVYHHDDEQQHRG